MNRIPPLFPGTNVLLIEILTPLDVRREVDLFRQLGDVNFEPILNFIKDFGVRLVRDEGDGKALELWNKMSSIIFECKGFKDNYFETDEAPNKFSLSISVGHFGDFHK